MKCIYTYQQKRIKELLALLCKCCHVSVGETFNMLGCTNPQYLSFSYRVNFRC